MLQSSKLSYSDKILPSRFWVLGNKVMLKVACFGFASLVFISPVLGGWVPFHQAQALLAEKTGGCSVWRGEEFATVDCTEIFTSENRFAKSGLGSEVMLVSDNQAKNHSGLSGGESKDGSSRGIGGSVLGTLGEQPTVQQTLEFMNTHRIEIPDHVWEMMPTSYRKDFNAIVRDFARTVDSREWERIVKVLQQVKRLTEEKSDFLLRSVPNLDREELEALSRLIAVVVDSKFLDQQAMKSFDGNRFFGKDFLAIKSAGANYASVSKQPFPASTVKFELISSDGKTATVSSPQSVDRKVAKWVRIENRWLPESAVAKWNELKTQANGFIKMLGRDQGKQMIAPILGMAQSLSVGLSGMLDAKSQDDFDLAAKQANFFGLFAMANAFSKR